MSEPKSPTIKELRDYCEQQQICGTCVLVNKKGECTITIHAPEHWDADRLNELWQLREDVGE